MRRPWSVVALVLGIGIWPAAPLQAALYDVTGTVQQAAGPFAAGEAITVRLTIDLATPDSGSGPNEGLYQGAILKALLPPLSLGGQGNVSVDLTASEGLVQYTAPVPPTGSFLSLVFPTGPLASDALVDPVAAFAALSGTGAIILGIGAGETGSAVITGATLVPVPAALPLLASAIAGLGVLVHRRRRQTLADPDARAAPSSLIVGRAA